MSDMFRSNTLSCIPYYSYKIAINRVLDIRRTTD
jgi:hypothetical protein